MEKRKIKSLTETTHIVNADGETVHQRVTYFQLRDEQGNVLEDASWQTNGNLENKTTYAYNRAGLVITQHIYLDEENISEQWTYEYGEDEKIASKAVEYADGSHSYYKKTIGEDGSYIWEIRDEDNEFEGREIRKYNGNNLLLSSVDIDDEDAETLRKEFVYDEKDLLTEQRIYEYEALSSREMMKYDDRKNLIHTINLSPGGNKISEIQYTYTNENKLAYYDVNKEVRTSYIYDEQGREIEIKRTNLNSELNMGLTQMKYNENGELTERLIYQMGVEYEVEPGVMGRGNAVHQKVVFSYEYW